MVTTTLKKIFSDGQIVEKVVEKASEQGIPEDSDEDDQAEKKSVMKRGIKHFSWPWICIYPAYINSKKTIAEGRRIPKDKAVENPTHQEIRDVLVAAGLNIGVENKVYSRERSREVLYRGRIRVQLKNDDGSLVNKAFPTKDISSKLADVFTAGMCSWRFRPSTTNTTSGAHGGIVQSRTEVDLILTDFDKDKREAIVSLAREVHCGKRLPTSENNQSRQSLKEQRFEVMQDMFETMTTTLALSEIEIPAQKDTIFQTVEEVKLNVTAEPMVILKADVATCFSRDSVMLYLGAMIPKLKCRAGKQSVAEYNAYIGQSSQVTSTKKKGKRR
ncbi:SRP19 protein [Homalodisca vitripennis]|nr:SRP19 protein [Homalodisca vitripennis]